MIPYEKSRSKTIFEGKLYSRQSNDIDMSKFKYLIITYAIYDYSVTNTAGGSNIILLDLSKKPDALTKYQCSNLHPYNIFGQNYENFSENMSVGIEVNSAKSNLKAIFAYNGEIQASTVTNYYVSKVVGIL